MYFILVFYLSYLLLEVNTQSTAITASKQMSSPEESTKQFHMFPLFRIHIKRTSWNLLKNFCPILPFYHNIWNPYLCGQPNQNLFSYSGLLQCLSSLPDGVLWRNTSLSIDCMLSMGVFAKVPLFNLFWVGIERLLSRNVALLHTGEKHCPGKKVRGKPSEKWSCATFNSGCINKPI